MRNIFSVAAVIGALLFVGPAEAKESKESTKHILILSGDLNKPYEIIDGLYHVKSIQAVFLGQAFSEAVKATVDEAAAAARKYGADAIINTQVSISIYPARTPSGEMGQVLVFGTLVKFKDSKTQEGTK